MWNGNTTGVLSPKSPQLGLQRVAAPQCFHTSAAALAAAAAGVDDGT